MFTQIIESTDKEDFTNSLNKELLLTKYYFTIKDMHYNVYLDFKGYPIYSVLIIYEE